MANKNGYAGSILKVDLSQGKHGRHTYQGVCREICGGEGICG